MADAAVDFLVQNLQQLLTHRRIRLIGGVEEHVKKLEKDLSNFMAFLKVSAHKHRNDAKLLELHRLMCDVVYDAEDIVDAFVTQKLDKSKSTKNYFLKAFRKPGEVRSIAEVVEAVNSSIRDIYDRFDHFGNLCVRDGDPAEEIETLPIRNANVVGFEDEAEQLKGYMNEDHPELDVISIIGAPGTGKTTLAQMIFNDPVIQYEFPIRIWVNVSSEFSRWDVFLTILKELKVNLGEDIYHKSEEQLAQLVSTKLERVKFLIVMDDVWLEEDWKELKIAFPKMGKVLITSRQEDVARYANRNRDPHRLRFFTDEESCLGLCLAVFNKREFPKGLEILGMKIARLCYGLPLAIEVIGGILARKYSPSAGTTPMENEWEKVTYSLITYLEDDPWRRMEKIISLSYNKLPHHLRACFLYFGVFPEDYEIPALKLIRMWIAEGFIKQKDSISLEETAENYLKDLINMNLVRIEKMTLDGRVKTCRILNILHQFCKTEAGNERENFLQEIKNSSDGRGIKKCRRLCVHSYISDFISSKPYGPCVRSLVCFGNDEVQLTNEKSSNSLITAFKLIRVLDVKPIKFSELSNDLFKLVHLRYIHLSLKFDYLPSTFSKLWNIQTLIIDTTSSTLEIRADIWEMIHLRHFKTKAAATLPKPGKNSEGGEKLQTLGTISPRSCMERVLGKARNLKKLGIRGKLALFLDGKIGSFDSLGKLGNLEKLKLLNDDGPSYGLPPHHNFPPKLRNLTLCGTFLEWRHITVLGLLENLKVLKLKDKAFMGESWEAADGGFRSLEFLLIERTDLEFWTASGHHFPSLRRLHLYNCEELREVPIGLADIPSLQLLDLHRTKFATVSARKIEDVKRKISLENIVMSAFKLSIFPPDE